VKYEYAEDAAGAHFRRTPFKNAHTYEMHGPHGASWHPCDPAMPVAHPDPERKLVKVRDLDWREGEEP
jgi:hypothetical protein